MPEWARVLQVAKWLNVAPWDLLNQEDSDFWMEAVAVLSNAEHAAQDARRAENTK